MDLAKIKKGMSTTRPSVKVTEKRMHESKETFRKKKAIIDPNTQDGQKSGEGEDTTTTKWIDSGVFGKAEKRKESAKASAAGQDTSTEDGQGMSKTRKDDSPSDSDSIASNTDSDDSSSSCDTGSHDSDNSDDLHDLVEPLQEEAWDDKVATDLDIPFHKAGSLVAYEEWERRGFTIIPEYSKSLTVDDRDKIMWISTGCAHRK
ncbi:MAG: hypothetical protein ACRYGR_01975 [Janthinobacterium lividum]